MKTKFYKENTKQCHDHFIIGKEFAIGQKVLILILD